MLPCVRVTWEHLDAQGSYHPNMPDLARLFCAHSRHISICDQCQREVGWAQLGRAMNSWREPRFHRIAGLLEVECEG